MGGHHHHLRAGAGTIGNVRFILRRENLMFIGLGMKPMGEPGRFLVCSVQAESVTASSNLLGA